MGNNRRDFVENAGHYDIDCKRNETIVDALKSPLTQLLSLGSQVLILPGAPIPNKDWNSLFGSPFRHDRMFQGQLAAADRNGLKVDDHLIYKHLDIATAHCRVGPT